MHAVRNRGPHVVGRHPPELTLAREPLVHQRREHLHRERRIDPRLFI
jgi:hypothetical protein